MKDSSAKALVIGGVATLTIAFAALLSAAFALFIAWVWNSVILPNYWPEGAAVIWWHVWVGLIALRLAFGGMFTSVKLS